MGTKNNKVRSWRSLKNSRLYKEAASEFTPRILPPKPGTPDTHDNTWSDELGEQLHALVAMGATLRKISWMERMPDYPTLLAWAADEKHPFYAIYKKARELRIIALEEEIEEIADTPEFIKRKTKRKVFDRWGESLIEEETEYDDPRHRQIRINARQFALSHLAPKKHGKHAELPDQKQAPKEVADLIAAFQELGNKLDGV